MTATELLPCKSSWVASSLRSMGSGPVMRVEDVAVEFTWRCFQKCRLCYGNFGPNLREMPFEQIETLERNLENAGVSTIHGTGGEILWHRDIRRIFKLFSEGGFRIEIDTNGTLIDERMADLLVMHNVEVAVGLESLRRDVYKWYRGADQLNDVLNGLKLLQERGLRPVIQSVVANFSGYGGNGYSPVSNTMELIQEMTQMDIPVVLVQHHEAGRAVQNGGSVVDLTVEERTELIREVNQLPEIQRRLVVGDIKFQRHFIDAPVGINCAGCVGGLTRANVDVDGNVFMCNWRREKSFGNVLTDNFGEIAIRMRNYRRERLEKIEMCNQSGCEFRKREQCFGPCLMAKICN